MNKQFESKLKPWVFNIELTNRCPFSCIMCARTNNMTRSEGDMSMELFTSIIDQLIENSPEQYLSRILRLHHFGESLVHPQVIDMISYASNKGLKTALSINPLQLTKKISAGLLDSGVHSLFVSLDGHDNASFEEIRGVKNAYEKSVERLKRFLKQKVKLNKDIHIELSMIDFKTNRESISMKSHDWETTEGIDDFRKKMFISWDGEATDVNELIDQDTQNDIDEFVANGGECYEPFKRVSILYDGRVVPCCFDYDGKYVLGDIHKKKLIDIWNDEPMLNLRKEFKSRQIKNKLCNNCKQKPGMIPITTTL